MEWNCGNGFELSAIRDNLNTCVDEKILFRNRDVPIHLMRQFDSSVDFTYSDVAPAELRTTRHKDDHILAFTQKQIYLKTLVHRQVKHQSSESQRHQTALSQHVQTLMSGNVSKFTMAQSSVWITCRQHIRRQTCTYPSTY